MSVTAEKIYQGIKYDRAVSLLDFRTNMSEALEALENGEVLLLSKYNKAVALVTGIDHGHNG